MKRLAAKFIFIAFAIGINSQPVVAEDYSCTNCFDHVSANGDHSCGVREDGSVTCWGRDNDGESTPPELSPENFDFAEVSAGLYHTCALVNCYASPGQFCPFGNTHCWGRDTYGQASPNINDRFAQISAGGYHTCGIKADGSIKCWGFDGEGQSTPPELPPESFDFTEVSAGLYHTCALVDCYPSPGQFCPFGNTYCWGNDAYGQASPSINDRFAQISAGSYHTCGIKADGSIKCWGLDNYGQSTPPDVNFRQVSLGEYHSCGVQADRSVACWGRDTYGQATPPGGLFQRVAAGRYHTCGVKTNGSVTCWGYENYNQILPTAGMCGLFHGDFEEGGDCRWSNGSMPCWNADCDGDGIASDEAAGYCSSTMPIGVPAECPAGNWIDQPAVCGAFDCLDDNADVYSGQKSYFSTGFGTTAGPSDRFDYNCDGVEEKRYSHMNGGSLYCVPGVIIGSCTFACPPPPSPCYSPGWDPATVAEIPACGETADYVTCGTGMFIGQCVSKTVQVAQGCR
jgi:hypothetical protein